MNKYMFYFLLFFRYLLSRVRAVMLEECVSLDRKKMIHTSMLEKGPINAKQSEGQIMLSNAFIRVRREINVRPKPGSVSKLVHFIRCLSALLGVPTTAGDHAEWL